MPYNTSIFDRIQTQEQKRQLLIELQTELLIMPLSDYKENVKVNFKFKDNESMLQAKFYHLCKNKNIECYLQVKVKNGLLDAVIRVNNRYYIIEFKYLKNEELLQLLLQSKSLKNQLTRYIKEKCQIIIVTNHDDINQILLILEKYDLTEQIYFYNQEKKWLSPLILNG